MSSFFISLFRLFLGPSKPLTVSNELMIPWIKSYTVILLFVLEVLCVLGIQWNIKTRTRKPPTKQVSDRTNIFRPTKYRIFCDFNGPFLVRVKCFTIQWDSVPNTLIYNTTYCPICYKFNDIWLNQLLTKYSIYIMTKYISIIDRFNRILTVHSLSAWHV